MMGHVFHVISIFCLHCAPHKITHGSSLLMEKSKVEESPRLEKQTSKKKKRKKQAQRRKKERVPSFGNFARYCVVLLNAPLSN